MALLAAALAWPGPSRISAADPGSCDPARPHAAGDFSETIVSGGLMRSYELHVPPSYTGSETVALILNWHGLGGTASGQQFFSGLPAKADEAGFIVVAPQGLDNSHNFLTLFPEPDDVGFAADLLDTLGSELCIDPAQVFSTGLSNGALMSVRLACNLAGRFAAIGPVSGVYFPPALAEVSDEPPCISTRPVALIAFHGTADGVIPFDGGPGIFDLTWRDVDDEILPEWAAHNGCASVPTDEEVEENVRLVRYQECDEGATVELYVVEGGGHTWFGALGAGGISATDLMWEFFQAHPMPEAQEVAPTPTLTPEPAATTSPPQPSATAQSATLPATGAGDGSGGAGVLAAIIAGISAAAIALGGAAWWLRRRRLYSS